MKIVYLHQYFVTPSMAGGGRSYEMARRLVAAGHEVHMVTSDQDVAPKEESWRRTVEAGIDVHWASVPYDNSMSYGRRVRAFFEFAWLAGRRAASLNADVIFATSTPLTIALPAVFASRRAACPLVFEVRDLWPAVPIAIGAIRNPLLIAAAKWLERFAYRNSSRVVALAPGMAESVAETGYPSEKLTVIPNGCDLATFADESVGQDLRSRYPWLGSRKLVVFTGTFGLVNGMDYLPRLAAAVLQLDPEVRFVAVGGGREFGATETLARTLGVLDRSLFLLGKQPKAVASKWTVAADINLALFTGPSIVWRDAVQNKFFDSLAAGRPVASNFRGWQSIVAEEAGAGLTLPADDIPAAAAALTAALQSDDWLESAGTAARSLAETRFDRDQLATQLERVLLAAVREGGRQ